MPTPRVLSPGPRSAIPGQGGRGLRRPGSSGRRADARTIGPASTSASSPFSGASRPTKTAGRDFASQRGVPEAAGTGTPLGRAWIRAGRSRPAQLVGDRRGDRDEGVRLRQRRPICAAEPAPGCQARSPVAPAPSGRSTTGNPSCRPLADGDVGIVLEHRDIQPGRPGSWRTSRESSACRARCRRTAAASRPGGRRSSVPDSWRRRRPRPPGGRSDGRAVRTVDLGPFGGQGRAR